MHLDLTTHPFRRDGTPAILAAAWIDPATLAAATPAARTAHEALLTTIRPDCLLWAANAARGGSAPARGGSAPADSRDLERAAAFARDTHLPVLLQAPPRAPAPPGLIFHDPAHGPLPFPAELCPAEAQGPAHCDPRAWILAFARRLSQFAAAQNHPAPTWATRLFAAPPDPADPAPAEQFARIAHRLQSFTRKHGQLFLRTHPLTAGDTQHGFAVVEQPARLELTVRQLEDRPVVLVIAVNPSAHPVDGRLVLALPCMSREVDLGRQILPAGRFAVVQIAKSADKRTRQNQPPPQHEPPPRKKGHLKVDHTRELDLLNTGIRLSPLFRPTQV